MDDTIDELVEASFLPISVIIIGIGNGDFGNMDILDADDNPLYDRNNRKADRDLVQFVPFFKYSNDGEKLAEQVLEEVPRQVIEYYQHNNIIFLKLNYVYFYYNRKYKILKFVPYQINIIFLTNIVLFLFLKINLVLQ
jgi:hypothetical protein